jgi:DNA-binding MarR family transcriptional regulator
MGIKNQEALMGLRQRFDLTPLEFLFLMYLGLRGNDEDRPHKEFNKARHRGECWPSLSLIEEEIGIRKDNVDRIMVALETKTNGVVQRCKNFRGRKGWTYLVDYPVLTLSTTQPEYTQGEVKTVLKVRDTVLTLRENSTQGEYRTGIGTGIGTEENMNPSDPNSSPTNPVADNSSENSAVCSHGKPVRTHYCILCETKKMIPVGINVDEL